MGVNRRLNLEPLEDRRVLATIVVDSLADNLDADGQITLREAIAAANNDTVADAVEGVQRGDGDDTIEFDAPLAGGTILLTQGELQVLTTMTLTGSGQNGLTISGGNTTRLFTVDDGNPLSNILFTISRVSLRDGYSEDGAGGIDSFENLVLDDVLMQGHRGALGAEVTSGSIQIAGSQFTNNSYGLHIVASDESDLQIDRTIIAGSSSVGALLSATNRSMVSIANSSIDGGDATGIEIRLSVGAHATLSDSSIQNNQATGLRATLFRPRGDETAPSLLVESSSFSGNQNRGIVIDNQGGEATLSGLTVTENSRGIDVHGFQTSGNTLIEKSTISKHSGNFWGAGLLLRPGRLGSVVVRENIIEGNSNTSFGGGIYTRSDSPFGGGTVVVENNVIAGNDAQQPGGGIYIALPDTVVRSNRIYGNRATEGGGIYVATELNDPQALYGNSIYENRAANGAGIFLAAGTTTPAQILQSTVSNNTADGFGGGVFALGGAAIAHSTIAQNTARTGGGIFVQGITAPASVALNHTIVAGNVASAGTDLFELNGSFDPRFSLIGSAVGADLMPAPVGMPDADGNLIGTPADPIDPLLQPLVESAHGAVHNLLPTSPAIDAGDENAAIAEEYDQRGAPFTRVVGNRIDVGAVEFQTLAPGVLLVDTTEDINDGDYRPGNLSLREAVAIANGSFGADIIRFELPAGSIIALSGAEQRIVEDIGIVGPGTEQLTIESANGHRIFNFDDGRSDNRIDVAISGLTLSGEGPSRGSLVYAAENLHAESLILHSASTDATSDMYIQGHTLNVALHDVRFAPQAASGAGGWGLAVNLTGAARAEVFDLVATKTKGSSSHSAVRIEARDESNVTIERARIERSSSAGLRVVLHDDAQFSLVDSQIEHNANRGLTLEMGEASRAVVHDSVIANNVSTSGGGISASLDDSDQANLLIDGTTVVGNSAVHWGGGIALSQGGRVYVRDTLIANNTAGEGGGGIAVSRGFKMVNSVVSGNSAPVGSGIYVHNEVNINPILQNVTVSDNVSSREDGGAIYVNTGRTVLRNTIIAGNFDPSGSGADIVSDRGTVAAQFSLIGFNRDSGLAEAPSGAPDANGNFIGGPVHGVIDPRLAPLADNGGPVPTHALLAGSAAIDAGDPAAVAGEGDVPGFDQRGEPFARVRDGDGDGAARIDIGAFELQEPPQPEILPGDYNGNGLVEQADLDLVLGSWGRTADAVSPRWVRQPPVGIVDQTELDAVLGNWGRRAAPVDSTASAAPGPAAVSERSRYTDDARTDIASLDRAFATRRPRAVAGESADDMLDGLVARTALARARARLA